MKATIYHNPRCSKSRQTLALMEEKGINPEIVEYLNSPPDRSQLSKILSLLNLRARVVDHDINELVFRKNEALYKEKELDNSDLTEDELIDIMVNNPILIERPIVLANGKAVIGRPPENVLKIL